VNGKTATDILRVCGIEICNSRQYPSSYYREILILFTEIIAVCSQIHTKNINTLCAQKVIFFKVKLVVHIVTTGLWRLKSELLKPVS